MNRTLANKAYFFLTCNLISGRSCMQACWMLSYYSTPPVTLMHYTPQNALWGTYFTAGDSTFIVVLSHETLPVKFIIAGGEVRHAYWHLCVSKKYWLLEISQALTGHYLKYSTYYARC